MCLVGVDFSPPFLLLPLSLHLLERGEAPRADLPVGLRSAVPLERLLCLRGCGLHILLR